jgi:hypothetical protein
MPDVNLVTDDDLARAREDSEFRQKLLSDNLDRLLAAMTHVRNSSDKGDPNAARLLQEGVGLAVKLAEMIQRSTQERFSERSS